MMPYDCHKETYEGGVLEGWEEVMAEIYPIVMADSPVQESLESC